MIVYFERYFLSSVKQLSLKRQKFAHSPEKGLAGRNAYVLTENAISLEWVKR